VNNSLWELNDLVFTTPAILKFLVDENDKYDSYDINPSVIAIDEFDLLLSNPGVAENMLAIVRKFSGNSDPLFGPLNSKR